MNSTVTSELLNTSDLLAWADQKNLSEVTSYTEADLANRFLITLRGRGQDAVADASRSERFFQDDVTVQRVREAISCQCEDETLTVKLDTHTLQPMSIMSVSLCNHHCWAEFNGTHFLLDFPLTSCGTEGEMDEVNGKVRYTNTVFLWKPSNNETTEMNPLGVQISCETFLSSRVSEVNVTSPLGPEEVLQERPHTSPSLMFMELFVSEAYERRSLGPCVITALERLYVQVSVVSGAAVDLQSCWVSPLSDPQAPSDWYIIRHSCPHDPSVTLAETQTTRRQEPTNANQTTQKHSRRQRRSVTRWREVRENENTHTLKFSFILRPVFNNSIQFLHCSVRLCESQTHEETSTHSDCDHKTQIPAVTHKTETQQCEDRNLSRPVLVTSPVEFLARPAGKLSQEPAERSRQTPASYETDMSAVMVMVFVAFVMGVGLMGALWCIYAHTGRRSEMSQGDGCLETTELSVMLRKHSDIITGGEINTQQSIRSLNS